MEGGREGGREEEEEKRFPIDPREYNIYIYIYIYIYLGNHVYLSLCPKH